MLTCIFTVDQSSFVKSKHGIFKITGFRTRRTIVYGWGNFVFDLFFLSSASLSHLPTKLENISDNSAMQSSNILESMWLMAFHLVWHSVGYRSPYQCFTTRNHYVLCSAVDHCVLRRCIRASWKLWNLWRRTTQWKLWWSLAEANTIQVVPTSSMKQPRDKQELRKRCDKEPEFFGTNIQRF